MILPCLIPSNIRYISRVKWNNPGKGEAPFSTPRCSSDWKGSLLVTLDYGHQLYYLILVTFHRNSLNLIFIREQRQRTCRVVTKILNSNIVIGFRTPVELLSWVSEKYTFILPATSQRVPVWLFYKYCF